MYPGKSLYTFQDESAQFKCIDGSKTIPSSAVNDDYCDCADGSDEPGTAACINGSFYCANEGHIPSTIKSSRVNDGICDQECCDGSDEYLTDVKCPNNCAKIGAEFKKAEQQRKKTLKEGLRIKSDYISYSTKARIDRKKQIQDLGLEVANVTARVEELRIIKADAEVFESEINARKAKKEAAENLRTLPQKVNECRSAKTTLQGNINDLNSRVNQLRAALDRLASMKDVEEGAAFQALLRDKPLIAETLDLYDQFKLNYGAVHEPIVYPYDPSDSELVPIVDAEEEKRASSNDVDFEDPCSDPTLTFEECTSASFRGVIRHIFVSVSAPFTWAGWKRIGRSFTNMFSKVSPSEEAQLLRSDPPKARQKLSDAESLKSQLQSRLDELKKKEVADYGPSGEWEKVSGQCITFDTTEYVYEICFHDRASQKSKNGGSTDLGRFSRFGPRTGTVDDSNKYKYMLFDSGAHCWNGPARSVELELECGTENKILAVSEPSKCEYAMKVITPNACVASPPSKEKIHSEL
ncbi:hypothetical protein HDU97_009063 [Phlyctochytrium planicorne]|nr:hypothetical protein HDU97_009063 [Phlyctochytrium planicorne]